MEPGKELHRDQIPEALLPVLAVKDALDLSLAQIAIITVLFLLLEIPLVRLLHRVGFRDQPY